MDAFFLEQWGPIEAGLSERVPVKDVPSIDLIWHRVHGAEHGLWLRSRGMSDAPLTTPKDAGVPDRVELVMCIPDGWRFTDADGAVDLDTWWFGKAFKSLALLPHVHRSWFSMGHTVTLSEDGRTPLHPTTLFTDVLLEFPLPPPPPRFEYNGTVCMFLQPVFLTAAEAAEVHSHGLEALSRFGPPFDYRFSPARACSVTGLHPKTV